MAVRSTPLRSLSDPELVARFRVGESRARPAAVPTRRATGRSRTCFPVRPMPTRRLGRNVKSIDDALQRIKRKLNQHLADERAADLVPV